MNPLYIFDLDGTLADVAHRVHIIDNKNDPNRYEKFDAACIDDTPVPAVVKIFKTLLDAGNEIAIWTCRSDAVRKQTIDWFVRNKIIPGPRQTALMLRMRPDADWRSNEIIKHEWLEGLSPYDRNRLVCVFEDRNSVVEMWRDNDVPCMQVAPGDF